MYIYELLTMNNGEVTRAGLLNVVAFVIALFTAMIFHEIAHGYVAFWNGDPTAKLSGRLSLRPSRHVDVIGFLMLLVCGFGWAKPVPVNPNNFKNPRKAMILVSLAGVAMNLVLAFVFTLFMLLLQKYYYDDIYYVLWNYLDAAVAKDYLAYFAWKFCQLVISLNLCFAIFNLLPLYPLDGYRLLSCFVPQENGFMTFLRRYSFYILMIIIILGKFISFDVVGDLMSFVANKLLWLFESFWRLII